MKTTLKLSTLAFVLSASLLSAAPSVAPKVDDAKAATAWVTAEIKKDPAAVTDIAGKAADSSPQYACEITKAAIIASKASDLEASKIVEAVGIAAPEQLDTAAKCAVAVRPEAGDEVNAVRASINPQSSPLDFPGAAGNPEVSPQTGPGSATYTAGAINQYQPPVVDPTAATNNDVNN